MTLTGNGHLASQMVWNTGENTALKCKLHPVLFYNAKKMETILCILFIYCTNH